MALVLLTRFLKLKKTSICPQNLMHKASPVLVPCTLSSLACWDMYHVVMWGGWLQHWPQILHFTMCKQLSMWLCCYSQEKVGSISSSAEAGLGHVTCCCQWDVSKCVARRCSMTFAHLNLPAYCSWHGCDYHQGKELVVHRDTGPSLPMIPADIELMAWTWVRPSSPAEPLSTGEIS